MASSTNNKKKSALEMRVERKKKSQAAKRKAEKECLNQKTLDAVSSMGSDLDQAEQKLLKQFVRKIESNRTGVSTHTLASHERSQELLEELKAKGLLSPAYEARSKTVKLQCRVPIEYRDVILDEAKQRGVSQSEVIRLAIRKLVSAEVRKTLPEVRLGRPVEGDS